MTVNQKMTGQRGCHYASQSDWQQTFSGREPLWGWSDDTSEIMENQIDLAADNGIAFFSILLVFCRQ